MKSLMRTTSRGIAAGLAGVLVASTAALVAAPAQAAPVTGDLKWNVSQQFVEHLFFSKMGPVLPQTPTGTLSGGVTHSAGDPSTGADDYFTFQATDAVTAADGTITTSFTGTVRGAFVARGAEQYAVSLTNPVVVRGADGAGAIKATVSGSVGTGTPTAAVEATVAEFSSSTTSGGVTSVTPDWEGVLTAGSPQAVALGIDASLPSAGKSFHPDFLGRLAPGTLAHFHNSSATAAQDHKRPGSFSFSTAEVLTPKITSTVLLQDREDGVSIAVNGTGFTAVTNPGDAGVYVALAPVGTVIDFADRGSLESMASVDYVTPNRFVGNDFTANLNAPTEKLEVGKDYAVFTWQAHTHSNATQDTTTPVTIDWSKFTVASKAALKVNRKATLKKNGKATVTLTGADTKPTGEVTFTTKAPGIAKTAKKTVKVSNGRAVLTLPKGKKGGRYTVTATYAGDALHLGAAKQTKRFVVKAAGKTTVKVTKKATTKRSGKARIVVKGKTTAGVAKARGKVKVTIKAPGKKTVKRTVKLKKNGKVAVNLPKAAKRGTYKISAKYVGNKNYTAAKKKTARYKAR